MSVHANSFPQNYSIPQGFSLIEVLVSLFLLGMVLLGLDAMELHALQESKKNYFQSLMECRLFALEERMRAANGHIEEQWLIWKKENAKVFKSINGEISGDYPNYHITISWPVGNTLSEAIVL